ncbi:hypothetical protein [Nocardia cyriacigeorgica]|uniref:Uncharacterized protein n=1 Tax=Nocardia cyriacigeorgica (strain GUH-2) TaxID=1127134 RepID=H6R9V9_NOCCG|nr:hypothetical protein [Nocardia cyriacigeorgica]CCF61167.1 exported protein of unknown function [Nocardia cyriacigeorgica GUH-2]
MNEHQAANMARRKRMNRNTLIVIGVLFASFLLCAGLGALVGPTESADESAARTTQFAAPPTTEPVAPEPAPEPEPVAPPATEPEPTTEPVAPPATEPEPTTEPVAPPVREAAGGTYSDHRCAAASDTLVALVSAGLTKSGHTLANGTVVDGSSGTTYFGATTLKPDGRMDNRSDVWIIRDGLVYASTGGARHGSIFPKASDVLDISPGDELVQLADRCVIDLTMP